jgi:hypothetical protein
MLSVHLLGEFSAGDKHHLHTLTIHTFLLDPPSPDHGPRAHSDVNPNDEDSTEPESDTDTRPHGSSFADELKCCQGLSSRPWYSCGFPFLVAVVDTERVGGVFMKSRRSMMISHTLAPTSIPLLVPYVTLQTPTPRCLKRLGSGAGHWWKQGGR